MRFFPTVGNFAQKKESEESASLVMILFAWVWHRLVKVAPSLHDPIKHGGMEKCRHFLMSGASLWCILIPKDNGDNHIYIKKKEKAALKEA
jgi:hypothetical protein